MLPDSHVPGGMKSSLVDFCSPSIDLKRQVFQVKMWNILFLVWLLINHLQKCLQHIFIYYNFYVRDTLCILIASWLVWVSRNAQWHNGLQLMTYMHAEMDVQNKNSYLYSIVGIFRKNAINCNKILIILKQLVFKGIYQASTLKQWPGCSVWPMQQGFGLIFPVQTSL